MRDSMQTFLTKAKETTLQKKRNLFGLGFTSLIAACSSESASAPNPEPKVDPEPDTPLPFDLSSDQELTPLDPFTSDEYIAAAVVGSDVSTVTAQITYTGRNNPLTDNIAGAEFRQGSSHANLYKFENDASSSSFNLVVAAPFEHIVDTEDPLYNPLDENDPSYRSGIVKVYWGLTPDSTSLNSVNSLTINGIKKSQIGKHAPEFFLLGTSSTKKYDMLIKSDYFIGASEENAKDTGAIHILWDVADYSGSNKTIDLGNLADDTVDPSANVGAASGSLTIYDGNVHRDTGKKIGDFTPNFLQINDKDGYDMLIRAPDFDARGRSDFVDSGAIFILWDVANYSGSNKNIDLGRLGDDRADPTVNVGATAGSLAIYGARGHEWIGDHPVNFLQIGGKTDEQKYDMVFEGWHVDKRLVTDNYKQSAGAIHILWDVADYYSEGTAEIIYFHEPDSITYGSLIVYGAKLNDEIGTYAPEFLQIAGKTGEQKHDMVFSSLYVDKNGDGNRDNGSDTNEGAIYILWDVADYYSEGKNKAIDLATPEAIDTDETLGFGATSGLLTIYGRGDNAKLGEKDDANNINNNILYDANDELTNIDGDTDGTKDIALTDGKYAYIFFGNQIADKGSDEKVDSKTIDLGAIEAGLGGDDNAGFFEYNFTDGTATKTTTKTADSVGYRFAADATDIDNSTPLDTLAEVQAAYDLI